MELEYRTSNPMTFNFSEALMRLRRGCLLRRVGWQGGGQFIFLVGGSTFSVSRAPLLGIFPEGTVVNYYPHIDMRVADGTIVTWTAGQMDLLSEDWIEVL